MRAVYHGGMANLRIQRHSSEPGDAHALQHGCQACLVRHLAVCTALPAESAHVLEAMSGDVKLEAGQLLAREGDPRKHVFTVTAGALRRVRMLPDGRRLVAGFLMPGDYIGFSGAPRYRHSIEAITASTLCALSRADMLALCVAHPGLEHELYERACIELDDTRHNLMALARMTPPERLATFLLDMAKRRRRLGEDEAMVQLPMARPDIADYLGLTVETVSRSFTKLRNEGVLSLDDPQHVRVLDRARLEALAEAAG
ncbi:MAG: Crp/Fnr family transcriptional regulator [Pseudoxanthomonas sp.]